MAFIGRSNVRDPGEQDQWERLARRREQLYLDDEQFRDTKPDEEVAAAARVRGLRIADYPHNESRFGYSERSLAAVVDAVGPTTPPGWSAETSNNSWESR
jgi:hypothetical protein